MPPLPSSDRCISIAGNKVCAPKPQQMPSKFTVDVDALRSGFNPDSTPATVNTTFTAASAASEASSASRSLEKSVIQSWLRGLSTQNDVRFRPGVKAEAFHGLVKRNFRDGDEFQCQNPALEFHGSAVSLPSLGIVL